MAQTNIFATRTGMGTIPGRATCMLSSGKASKEIHELAQAPFVRQWTVVPVRVPACVGSLSLVAERLLHLLLRGKIQMPKFYRKLNCTAQWQKSNVRP